MIPATDRDRVAAPAPASPVEAERDWVGALTSAGPDQDVALRDLHGLLIRAARHQVWRMRSQVPHLGPIALDDLANAAADEALTAMLPKLHTFEGRSRFTTWAYKFAILQAANEIRREAWSRQEVTLHDDPPATSTDGPEAVAVGADLAAAVTVAMHAALTTYQRRIAIALLVDGVPIDVLADRLGTTRGALYKTLHVARSRLRAHLVASGHLHPEPPQRGTA